MSNARMITVFERERIVDRLGSQDGKIQFLQSFPRVVRFSKRDAVFNVSGVFQIPGGPPILVLPWFLKDNQGVLNQDSTGKRTGQFFEIISEIKAFQQSGIDLDTNANALDIIVHSYLLNMVHRINSLTTFNFHENLSEDLNVIKGRWNVAVDLRKGEIPLKFNCSYDSLGKDIPVLLFAKAFFKWLSKVLSARSNLALIDQGMVLMKEVDSGVISTQLIRDAREWCRRRKGFDNWLPICDFAEGMILEKSVYSSSAGISYQFKMDKFFENVIFKLCQQISGSEVRIQTREQILGGAVWRQNETTLIDGDDRSARQYSIPDIVVEDSKNYFVIECKYKPFKVPLINEKSGSADLVRYGPNDRNQLLSFLLSLRPSPTIGKKNIQFSVIFPCREVETILASNLTFTSAKLHIDPVVRNIIQNKSEFSDSSRLTVRFIALNVAQAIKQLLVGDKSMAAEIFECLTDAAKTLVVNNGTTNFQRTLEKRLALASLIINEGRNDKTLGRVKLAKLFYLTDVHLNLNMQAQYARYAMGPLDNRLIRNEEIGVEPLGVRYAYYKVQETKKDDATNERTRYTPGANISTMLNRLENIFPDKAENIDALIKLLLPLNTEQSEIVATLYACWNDLILQRNREITDVEVITEFRSNWHQSKARFDQERLMKALDWMREKGLVPYGNGSRTTQRIEQQASGF